MIEEIERYGSLLMEWWGDLRWYFMLALAPLVIPLLGIVLTLMLIFERDDKR